MTKKIISREFFYRPATELAPALLGKLLCANIDGRLQKLRITETEAYCGESDTACHAHKGRTKRTATLYEKGGNAYIYLCYGIHHLLNVVAGEEGVPHAVLIRGVEGFDGPGKLTKAMGITTALNGEDMLTSAALWLEDDGRTCDYVATPRIGIDYATEEYRNMPWRYVVHKDM